MENIVYLITGGSTEFTPQVLVGFLVFVIIIDSICSIIKSVLKVGNL